MAELLVPPNPRRTRCGIYNTTSEVAYLGNSDAVTERSGLALPVGAYLEDTNSTDAWWVAGDASGLRFIEDDA